MKRRLAQAALITILSAVAFGQSPQTLPSFEATDIHVSPRDPNPNPNPYPQVISGFLRGGQYVILNSNLVDLISLAYGIPADRVLGGPSWLEINRFDVLAKTASDTTIDTAKLMVRSLLGDRFKLVFHNEDKPESVYVLTAGKRGPQLKEAAGGATNCQGVPQSFAAGAVPYQVVSCKNMTMAAFAEIVGQMASAYIDKRVIDMTGLRGEWDFEIKWTGRGNLAAAGKDGITIFDAVEKQLGLKLELQTRTAPALVIDRVNRKPTDNAPNIEKVLPAFPSEFEVAEIKPSDPNSNVRRTPTQSTGRMDLRGFTVKELIMIAWNITNNDFVVTPKALETQRFDVVARTPLDLVLVGRNTVDLERLREMSRNLVIGRFKVKFHMEDQPVSVYTLLSPKQETKLKKADPNSRTHCIRTEWLNASGARQTTLTCQNTTMAQFAERLGNEASSWLDRPTIDMTKLEGGWDFELKWTPQNFFNTAARGQAPNAPGTSSDPNGGVTVFEAVEKQLGLKIELQKHPMPVLVVDHAEEKPTEN
jgi:uncharacterized protein (TIGR03435 family)